MVSLVDIAPTADTVAVGEQNVEVYGVSMRGVAHLLGRFPELRMLMTGRDVGADQLMEMAPNAVAAILAAGTGQPGDAAAEAAADRLAVETQVDLLSAIMRLTLPKGVGPFVEKITQLGLIASPGGGVPTTVAQAMKSQRPSKR
jgi:hypothetical protein